MIIRSAAKAAIVREGRLLLQACRTAEGIHYYELPGGGQNDNETLEEAVVRECREETGYAVAVRRLLGVQEEIFTNPFVQKTFPEHAHRIFHIYLCDILRDWQGEHTEEDVHQIGLEWVPLDRLGNRIIRPQFVPVMLCKVLESGDIGYLPVNLVPDFFS